MFKIFEYPDILNIGYDKNGNYKENRSLHRKFHKTEEIKLQERFFKGNYSFKSYFLELCILFDAFKIFNTVQETANNKLNDF